MTRSDDQDSQTNLLLIVINGRFSLLTSEGWRIHFEIAT